LTNFLCLAGAVSAAAYPPLSTDGDLVVITRGGQAHPDECGLITRMN